MPRPPVARLAPLLVALACLVPAARARAQEADTARAPARLGLAASGSVGAYTGLGLVREATPGALIGGSLDLGSLRDPFLLRLVLDVSWLYGGIRQKDSLGAPVTGPFYDLAGHVSAELMLKTIGRFEPFVAAGVGAHAAGADAGYLPVDDAFNSNVLGAHAAAGTMMRLRRHPRTAIRAEVRGILASAVGRVELRVGLVRLFRDLAAEPPPGQPR